MNLVTGCFHLPTREIYSQRNQPLPKMPERAPAPPAPTPAPPQQHDESQETGFSANALAQLLKSFGQQDAAPAAEPSDQAGLNALGYGTDSPQVNPNTGDKNWYGWGLGWVNQAMQSVGQTIPELQVENSQISLEQAQANGHLQQGEPVPGSIVYYEQDGKVKMGIVGPDGQSVQTTQPPDADGNTIGTIPMPDETLGWLSTAPVEKANQAVPVQQGDAQDPASFYVTQNATDYNPNGSINANCGPASLAMAAWAFGKLPAGADPSNPENMIETVREEMTGNRDIQQLTGDDDVIRGAQAMGMQASSVASLDGVNSALDNGQMVVAGGDPSAYSDGHGGHFLLVTGRSPDGGYIVNDPAYTGRPGVVLTPEQFAAFFGSGIAVGP